MKSLLTQGLSGLVALGVLACGAVLDPGSYKIGTAPGDDAGAECRVNADCSVKGEYVFCRQPEGTCVSLQSPECTRIVGNYQNDNAIFVGSVGPTTGADRSSGLPLQNSIELAIGEFHSVGDVAPRPGSTARRPLVLVGCDDASDDEQAIRAANHLANDVRVPAIIGAAFSGITIKVANAVTIPAGVMLISPSATSVAITSLADNRLVWRTSPSDLIQADAHVALFPLIEQKIKATIGAGTTLKVAIAHRSDAYGKGLATAVQKKLRFNERPALDQDQAFKVYDYGDPDDVATSPTKYASVIEQILGDPPHAIFLFGITETITEVMKGVELGWSTGGAAPPRPFYLLADGSLLPEVSEFAGANPDVRKRILGTIPGSNRAEFKAFRIAYAGKFNDGTSADVGGTANAYDALYNIAFAAGAIGDKPLTGPNLRDGFAQLVGGAPVGPGTDNINSAFQMLSAGVAIDYTGASGPLDYDLATGEAASDIQIWCVPIDGSNKTLPARQSTVFYDAAGSRLVGSVDGVEAAAACAL